MVATTTEPRPPLFLRATPPVSAEVGATTTGSDRTLELARCALLFVLLVLCMVLWFDERRGGGAAPAPARPGVARRATFLATVIRATVLHLPIPRARCTESAPRWRVAVRSDVGARVR